MPFISLFNLALATAVVYLLYILWRQVSSKGSKLPLPPSPPGWPVVGNLPEIVKAGKLMHLQIHEWARQYGEIMSVRAGPVNEIFINSDEAVDAIFCRNTAYSSERPPWIVGKRWLRGGLGILLMDASNPRWKLHRKITNQNLTSLPRADAGLPYLYFETLKFMYEVSHDPDAGTDQQTLWTKFGRYIYSTFSQQLFGLELASSRSDAMDYIFQSGLEEIMSTNVGTYLVDIFNFLDYLPKFLKPWEEKAKARFTGDMEFCRKRVEYVQGLIAKGTIPDAFLPRMLTDNPENVSSDEAGYVALELILGASDTSRMTAWGFLEQMMLFPDVQEKARKLIDDVCGDRLPVWEDLERLPYVRSMMKESWRIRAPVCFGLPHYTTKDIEYKGMLIPKGSHLRVNAWTIGHDPTRHSDPQKYMPERWANDTLNTQQSALLPDPTQRDHFAFGGGRRMCPGVHVADRSFAVSIMRMLWGFTISPKPGAKLPLDPKEYPHEVPGVPAPDMPVIMVVRPERKALIDEYYEQAVKTRVVYGNLDLQ